MPGVKTKEIDLTKRNIPNQGSPKVKVVVKEQPKPAKPTSPNPGK
jgi:hypothetical protein